MPNYRRDRFGISLHDFFGESQLYSKLRPNHRHQMPDNYRPESTAIANNRRLNDTSTVKDRCLKDAYTVYVCQYGLWLSRCENEPPYRPATEGPHYDFSKVILDCLRSGLGTKKFFDGDLGKISMLAGYAGHADLGTHTRKILSAEVIQTKLSAGIEIQIKGTASIFEKDSVCMLSYEDVPLEFSVTLQICQNDFERFWHNSFNSVQTVPPHWINGL